ncbi:hypothetical protein BV25DRAFT_1987693 [Artomyces pyxidatus]|uniref:Uncharacterized protein n=1 Tax=Artomyces pyxidatus TaxID=48021 RepID=A0ACB8TFR8_9AGAM|nr:hypothetical protein BV25DRAFT_1987693 [Artomyces pyxidatus]
MTERPASSNSLSDSQSSASDLHDPSPAVVPIPDRATSDDGSSPSLSPRPQLPHQTSLDVHRSSSASRGGCWTCRLRRKKCDEQREEGDSCRTCRRLQLNCLGWGQRRPDWMRDKVAVQNYKAEIKSHLLRLGLIRGQPRSSLTGSSVAASGGGQVLPRASTSSVHPTHDPFAYRFDDPHMDLAFASGIPSVPGNAPVPSSSSSAAFPDASSNDFYDLTLFGGPPHSNPPASSGIAAVHGDVYGSGGNTGLQFDTRPIGLSDPDGSIRREHVAYYFTHVRGLQFLFTCKVALTAVHSAITTDPQGALVNAICAISNLQYSTLQRASPLEALRDQYPDGSIAQYFYNQAKFQLDAVRRQPQYSENDALAAVHLISYTLAFDGGKIRSGASEWMSLLEVACDWLTQTGMHVEDNPRMSVINMSLPGAFAAKVTMCMDIFMAVTLQQPPRLLALYRRLLIGGTLYKPETSAGGSGSPEQPYELYVPLLVGCTEPVLLAFAEIAALAHWKAREQRNGTLSARELIMRGTAIERSLRQNADSNAFQGIQDVSSSGGTGAFGSQMSEEMTRRLVAAIFQETAVLYLNTVLSGSNPGVPEISSSTNTIAHLLGELPVSSADCGLVLPLTMAGCLADAPATRDALKKRLLGLSEASANVRQIVRLMMEVWQRRDTNQGPVEWRDVMQERGLSLLLV